jgi:phytoene synthase
LFAIDDAMADVVAQSTQPALAAIKLAWWRERLEDLDDGKVPAEPRLQAAAEELLPRGVSGRELARLEDGWAALLDEEPDETRIAERGAQLFSLGAALLGGEASDDITWAGRLFAPIDVVRRGLSDAVPAQPDLRQVVIDRPLRPLTALSALALRGPLEPEATPGRAWALLRHRLTGRI